jgi:hypothetical protein
MGLIALIVILPACIFIDRYKRPAGIGMRLSTKIAILAFVAWPIFNTIANASAPGDINDPKARATWAQDIRKANFWGRVGDLSFVVGVLVSLGFCEISA